MERWRPASPNPAKPPIRVNGIISSTSNEFNTDLNAVNKTKKISMSESGTITLSRFMERCWFSNCPPHVMAYPGGNLTWSFTLAMASFTKLPWSRLIKLALIATMRDTPSRPTRDAPCLMVMSDISLSGMVPALLGKAMGNSSISSRPSRNSWFRRRVTSNRRSPS